MGRARAAVGHILPKLTTFSPVLVVSSVENWGILRGTVLRKKVDDASPFSSDKDLVKGSEISFNGVVCEDHNTEADFAKNEETFSCNPSVEENEETFCATQMSKRRKRHFCTI